MAVLAKAAAGMEGLDRSNYNRAFQDMNQALRAHRAHYVRIDDSFTDDTYCCDALCCDGCGSATLQCIGSSASFALGTISLIVTTLRLLVLPAAYYLIGVIAYKYLEGYATSCHRRPRTEDRTRIPS